MNTDAIRRFLTILSSAVKVERGQLYQLIQSAETSYYLRDIHAQLEIGLALQAFGYPFNQVGKYYESMFLYRTGQIEKARQLLECVAESAPARYRSKALFSLSAVEAHLGRFEESLRLRLRIPAVDDPVLSLQTQQSVAVLWSQEGEHHAALRELERLLPLAHIIGKSGHPAYPTFLNSYALELSEIGKDEEAERVANVVAASPFIGRYREWQETILEIAAKRKRSSMVAVPNELNLEYGDPRIRLAIDFMNANFHRKIARDEIAEVINSSSTNFGRVFKLEAGVTPIEYLIRLRLEKARQLLRSSLLSVKEVMAAVGYNSKSLFARHFKRQFGITPTRYRRRFYHRGS